MKKTYLEEVQFKYNCGKYCKYLYWLLLGYITAHEIDNDTVNLSNLKRIEQDLSTKRK